MAISWLKGVVGGKLPVCFLFGCKFPPFFFPTLLQQHNFLYATPSALWRGVKGLTPIAFVLEKETFAQKLQLSFFPTCFLCVERIFNFLETRIFKRCVFAGAMCFASGSIFGNSSARVHHGFAAYAAAGSWRCR